MIATDERVARFVSGALGFWLCPPYTVMGIERDGTIVAGVIFHCFEGPAVHVTLAGSGWTRGFIEEVRRYVFDQLGCERITVTSEQSTVIAYALRLGGQIEGKLRNQFGRGRDGVIVGILRDEWRFDTVKRH